MERIIADIERKKADRKKQAEVCRKYREIISKAQKGKR